ncbi:hypothetical protein ACAG26_06740 [Mycobacterium sp. pUA109]|uniref:hypothetical protein n=1 Tax=Mycobacterium sp. pUA109 TaxID=3238982 RepID=UPI00351AC4CB
MPFAVPVDPYHDERQDDLETFVTVDECARTMNITPERVRQLAKLRVLRTRYGWGDVLVQPAKVAGWT